MIAALALALGVCTAAGTAPLSGAALVQALRHGGYVIVMRHASAPTALPDAKTAAPGNTAHERQLDDRGKASVRAMGAALRTLKIAIGKIYSSPTFRARQTVALLDMGRPVLIPALGDGGHSMARIAAAAPAGWLRAQAAAAPRAGRNTLIVTHMPNLVAAFPTSAPGMGDGEALIFKPGSGAATLVAKIPMGEWPALAGAAH
jgi:phosphohistidine phosphatase SixA